MDKDVSGGTLPQGDKTSIFPTPISVLVSHVSQCPIRDTRRKDYTQNYPTPTKRSCFLKTDNAQKNAKQTSLQMFSDALLRQARL